MIRHKAMINGIEVEAVYSEQTGIRFVNGNETSSTMCYVRSFRILSAAITSFTLS